MNEAGVVVYLVRHADAGDKSAWRGVDGDRPLSTDGWREAAGLVVRLEDFPIDHILSSPALRCEQTVRPLATRNRLPVEGCDLLRIGADAAALAAFMQTRAADRAVLCTHGELFADLFPLLIAEGAVITDPLLWPKGATWILHGTVGGPLRARFLPPLASPVAPNRAHHDFGARRHGRSVRTSADGAGVPAVR